VREKMLVGLRLTNFRGFESHELAFKPITVAVGRNNAGKSTFIEALRLVSIVTNRYRNLSYKEPPSWVQIPRRYSGASPDLRNLQIDFDTICYTYRDPPAVVEAFFENGRSIKIFIGGENRVHAVLLDKADRAARTRSEARGFALPRVSILPQVAPLVREEKILTREHVFGSVDSPLASAHFRNQLRLNADLVPEFRKTAEETWPGLQIRELEYGRGYPGDPIFLLVRTEEFVGEIGKMGHGLQREHTLFVPGSLSEGVEVCCEI
jgi:AAA ATPase domain